MDQPPADAHAAVSYLNTTGQGIRTTIGCSCGQVPKAATRASTMHVAHARHRTQLGLPRFDYAATVYGPGYAAAGLTFEQWRAAGNTGDPYALAA